MSGTVTWPVIVHLLQGLNGVTWAIALGFNTPSLYRLWFGEPRKFDPYYAVAWFVALAQIGFVSRWFIWPDQIPDMGSVELQFWASLYVANALAPLALILLRYFNARGK